MCPHELCPTCETKYTLALYINFYDENYYILFQKLCYSNDALLRVRTKLTRSYDLALSFGKFETLIEKISERQFL